MSDTIAELEDAKKRELREVKTTILKAKSITRREKMREIQEKLKHSRKMRSQLEAESEQMGDDTSDEEEEEDLVSGRAEVEEEIAEENLIVEKSEVEEEPKTPIKNTPRHEVALLPFM